MQETMKMLFDYTPILLKGLGTTILVSCEAAIIGELVGLVIALLRMRKSKVLKSIISVYISFVRGTPLMIQIFLIYYVLAKLGVDIPAIQSGVIALSLNSGGYIAEILRGGFFAVSKGQYESGIAIGMSKSMVMRRIILPQVIKIVLPQFISEFICVIKSSPLLSIITVVELTRSAQRLVQMSNICLPFYIYIGVMYLIVCAALELAVNKVNKRLTKSNAVA